MDIQVNGDLLSIMLFYSLRSSFENFRCAIESLDALPIAEQLKIKIVEEYEAQNQVIASELNAMLAHYVKHKLSSKSTMNSSRSRNDTKQRHPLIQSTNVLSAKFPDTPR